MLWVSRICTKASVEGDGFLLAFKRGLQKVFLSELSDTSVALKEERGRWYPPSFRGM
jgi:hypothetical protein